MTLSQKSLKTHTTAATSPSFVGPDTLTVNGALEDVTKPRTAACLAALRQLRTELESSDPSLPNISTLPLHIVSANNFPTAAGLASSAAGFGALVRAVANLYNLPQSPEQLSVIARQGSGSACRSLMGGFVAWRAGTREDGSDSMAEQIAPPSHWPELRALILVASGEKKEVGSTEAMQRTTQTSTLFPARVKVVESSRMGEIEKAIREKDFETFARVTMQDSNSFHAVCLDSWPPVPYLNDASKAAMDAVHTINRRAGKLICAYTFDAGPNAVIYYLEEHTHQVAGVLRGFLREKRGWEGEYGARIGINAGGGLEAKSVMLLKSGIERVICTGIGEGPLKSETHLVDSQGRDVDVDPDEL